MKTTKRQLKRIIKEEKAKLMKEQSGGRAEAFELLDELEMMGIGTDTILNYIIGNHMSGNDAFQALSDFKEYEL